MRLDNHYQAFADPRAAGQVAGIQTGIDVWRGSLIPGHSDTAGLYLAYGNVDGLVTNPAATAYILQHTRSLNLNAYSVGATETIMVPAVRTSMRCCRARSTTALRQRNLPACRQRDGLHLLAGGGLSDPAAMVRAALRAGTGGQIIWQRSFSMTPMTD